MKRGKLFWLNISIIFNDRVFSARISFLHFVFFRGKGAGFQGMCSVPEVRGWQGSNNQGIQKAVLRIRIHLIRIRIQHFFFKYRSGSNPDSGFWRPKIEKNLVYSWKKKLNYCISKTIIYLFLGLHKGRPATEEAFSPRKRTSRTSKHEIS